MYVPTINSGQDEFSHAVARIDWPVVSSAGAGGRTSSLFLDYFAFSSPLWMQLPVLSASLRIDVFPDRSPVTWHGLTVAKADADLARQAIAAMLRLDGVEGAAVTCPGNLDDFNRAFVDEGEEWWGPDNEPSLTSGGSALFDTTRLFDHLPALLASAVTLGFALRYQAAFRCGAAHPDLVRRARKTLAGLERQPHVPPRLVETQTAIVERLQRAGHSAEEAVTVDPQAHDWLQQWMDANLAVQKSAGDGGSRPHRAIPLEGERQDALAFHLHPEVVGDEAPERDDLARVPQYWTDDEVGRLFRCEALWRPGNRAEAPPPLSPLPTFFRPSGGPSAPAPSARGTNGADQGHYFVSYAHKDVELIKPILARIVEHGNRIWIDDQIVVGEEWDTRLERMITTSAGLLVFLSPNYVASKHCRRELKFADALDKAIYACALADFPRQEGFGYIFTSLQYAIGTHSEIAEKLIAGLGSRNAAASATIVNH